MASEKVKCDLSCDVFVAKVKEAQRGQSLLETDEKCIKMEGYKDDRQVYFHLKFTNPTKNTISFLVQRPEGHAFHVSPKVGVIPPQKSLVLCFSFNGRSWRIPDDGAMFYHIFQAEMPTCPPPLNLKSSQRLGRAFWSKKAGEQCSHVLPLPVIFKEKRSNHPHETHVDPFVAKKRITTPEALKPTSQMDTANYDENSH